PEELAICAGRGDRAVGQRQRARESPLVGGRLDTHRPRLAVWRSAERVEIAAPRHDRPFDAVTPPRRDRPIHAIPLRNAAEIQPRTSLMVPQHGDRTAYADFDAPME